GPLPAAQSVDAVLQPEVRMAMRDPWLPEKPLEGNLSVGAATKNALRPEGFPIAPVEVTPHVPAEGDEDQVVALSVVEDAQLRFDSADVHRTVGWRGGREEGKNGEDGRGHREGQAASVGCSGRE